MIVVQQPPTRIPSSLAAAVDGVVCYSRRVLDEHKSIACISSIGYEKLLVSVNAMLQKSSSTSSGHICIEKARAEPDRELGLYLFFGVVNYCFKHPFTLKEYLYISPDGVTINRSRALLEALRVALIDWSNTRAVSQISPLQWQTIAHSSETELYDFEGRYRRIVAFGKYLNCLGIEKTQEICSLNGVDEIFRLLTQSGLFDDPFLKRAQLTTAQLIEHRALREGREQDFGAFSVMPDYRIPQLLYNMGVIHLKDPSLRERLIKWKVLEPDSAAEQTLRGAAVAVGQMLAEDLGISPAMIDALLWQLAQKYLGSHPCPIPHMLVPTNRY